MKKKYHVYLDDLERQYLLSIIATGKVSAYKRLRAQILLKADESSGFPCWNDQQIKEAFSTSDRNVRRIRQAFVEKGLEEVLNRKSLQPRHKKLDGPIEKEVIALACSSPPEGRAEWSLRLLADKLVELHYVKKISHETIRKTLKKNEIQLGLSEQWCIPPKANAEFVCAMEDVLMVYHRLCLEEEPQVCIDEASTQLIEEIREPLPPTQGHPLRYDYEYKRNGTSNLFMIVAPKLGWRHVKITQRRTNKDWAYCLKDLVDIHFSNARKIILVTDNLNTHKGASLYEAFPPEEAWRILNKIEWHYTPKHASWLDMSEVEISVLRRQCLNRRIPDVDILTTEIAAWENDRNQRNVKIHWTFNIEKDRQKLKKLYPAIS